jgi:ribosome-associated protein
VEGLELANHITDIVVDKQGQNVIILNIRDVTTIADYFVICSGSTRRQLDAMRSAIQTELKSHPERILPLNVEGTAESGWILMDYNGVIVHLFTPEVRDFYRIEELWRSGRVVTQIQ